MPNHVLLSCTRVSEWHNVLHLWNLRGMLVRADNSKQLHLARDMKLVFPDAQNSKHINPI